ncbi:sensor histidine kinase [Lachnoclostridium pacaense]|uniref:sensor histidine kinase n=1 Tax=Enterocloster hominis (ex Hitch et al. 2024) TaxID=1917870 RepID=UPI001D1091DF|nr:sensor histidine kinase [Lachnoclostridium pacaense]MCC2816470.1 sensor histidine kinase [Lachnoclostridium pacaense]MCD8168227.1 sensor histidine kinase [Clostridiales bacterium]
MKGFDTGRKTAMKHIPVMWLLVIVFVPVMVVTILIMGTTFQRMSYNQVTESSRANMLNSLTQSTSVLDSRMADLMERFQYIENSSDMLSLALVMSQENVDRAKGQYYINLRKSIDDQFVSSGSFLDSVIIDFNDSRFRMYRCEDIPVKIDFNYDAWYGRNQSIYNWSFLHDDTIFQVTDAENNRKNNRVFSLYRLYGKPGQPGRGGIVFNIRESMFRDMLTIPDISENGYVALIHDGSLIRYKDVDESYTLSAQSLRQLQQMADVSAGIKVKSVSGQEMMVYTRHLKTNGWLVAALLPTNEMFHDVRTMQNSIHFTMIAVIVCSVLACVVLSRLIVLPIKRLTDTVSVEDVTSIANVSSGGAREIQILSDKINELLSRVRQLIEQVKEEQEKKREAELSLMQEQINPHFLYNTLYSVQQLCELDESKEASAMVLALSNFFRTGLSRGEDVITIDTEINHVKNYLVIQHMKYGDKFEYEIEIAPDIRDCRILKLTLQPLVENALHHGIQNQAGKGMITITGKREGGRILFEVRDTGAGMASERLEQVRKSMNQEEGYSQVSFGLRNVYSRLMLYYDGEAGLEIESVQGRGTVIKVYIPVT